MRSSFCLYVVYKEEPRALRIRAAKGAGTGEAGVAAALTPRFEHIGANIPLLVASPQFSSPKTSRPVTRPLQADTHW